MRLIASWLDVHYAFALGAVISGLAIVATLRVLPASAGSDRPVDVRGAIVVAAGLVALLLAIGEGMPGLFAVLIECHPGAMQRGAHIEPTHHVMIEAADENGLMFPLDLGGRGSCTIGGNISTNAGGKAGSAPSRRQAPARVVLQRRAAV